MGINLTRWSSALAGDGWVKTSAAGFKLLAAILIINLPEGAAAQSSFYFHTINSSSLGGAFGKTAKVHYAYQLSHHGQLKLTGLYIRDEYDQNRNHIKADIYNAMLQMQQTIFFYKRAFVNLNGGIGFYYLEAVDKIGEKHIERKVNFAGGIQVEYYLHRNALAVLAEIDFLTMPFSDLYRFLGVPTVGIAYFF